MNAIDTKLNYFVSKLEQIKKQEMEFKMAEGQYNKEFAQWMEEQGIKGQVSLVELIQHFRKKSELVLP